MKTIPTIIACAVLAVLSSSACTPPAQAGERALVPFRSEAQFRGWIADAEARAEREAKRRRAAYAPVPTAAVPPPAPPPSVAPAATAQAESADNLDRVQVTGTRITAEDVAGSPAADGITNVQTQGVDEGGIVKKQGDFLVVLRRGRLFTLRIGGDRLEPVATVDAFGPGIDPDGAWYDEMLVSDDTVVVIGYSYDRGGTEIGLFDLDARGGLRHRATHHLQGNDYYSSRNYASRLVGDTLVFYTPVDLYADDDGVRLPGLRRWNGRTDAAFERLLPAQRIYRSGLALDPDDAVLHTVVTCDLAARALDCDATAVLGPSSREFYVAGDAVYVWTTREDVDGAAPDAAIFRMPLDGTAPRALRAWGAPVDQMAFLERDGWLHVLVGDENRRGMWAAEADHGRPALLRVPVATFGDARATATRRHYRLLDGDLGWGTQNRYVGDWLIYGGQGGAHAVRYATREPVVPLRPTHALERIEALGEDALLVGGDGADLRFTSVDLGTTARLADVYTQPGARQGESRTHGFFYRPRSSEDGVLGLPIQRGESEASVLYLRNRSLALSPLGRLDARRDPRHADDGCRASCVDWYGDARPIFIGDRVFALLGYELVEGREVDGRIVERRRLDFSPGVAIAR
ncbi:beta-propeller domain-containing protein [Lysobacter humi (ex Lee et al. 2017)]